MTGDRFSDVELARNAGLKAAFVLSGYGRGEWEHHRHKLAGEPDLVAEDLLEVVEKIIKAAD
jgi:phosphoglycolate phosphatase-like HAD superfamily hydrolase